MSKMKFSDKRNKRTEQSEERLLALMKATSDGIYRMSPDWKTMTEANLLSSVHDGIIAVDENMTITYWNESAEKITGWAVGEATGQSGKEIFSRLGVDRLFEEMTEELDRLGFYYREVWAYRKDGELVYVDLHMKRISGQDGKFRGTITTFRDITERKRTEEALRESEERYRRVVQNTSAVILYVSPQGIIRFANSRALEFFGYEEHELIGKHVIGTIVPEREKSGRDLAAMVTELSVDPERFNIHANENMCKSGERVWMEWNNTVIYDSEGRMKESLCVGIDATVRKRAEEALRERESRLRAILDSLPAAVLITDPTGQMIDANRALQEVWGDNAPLAAPELYIEYCGWWPETGKRLEAHEWPLAKSVRGETVRNAVIEIESFDGKRKFIRADSSPIIGLHGENFGAVAINEDITERKRAEEALAAERKRLLGILESLPVMICLLTPDRRVVFENRTFREKFGESGGRHCYEYCCGLDRPCAFCESFVPLTTGQPHHWEFISPDGDTVLDAYDFPFSDADGSPLILEMDIDITERRRAEEALLESEKKAHDLIKELEEADRNKNQFISVLSHELRNPLAAISAGVQMLDITRDTGEIEKAKEIIKRQTNQLCKLVDDLLEMTRISQNKFKLKKEYIDLNETVKSAAEDLRPEYAKKGIKLETEIQDRPVLLSADPVRVTQAIGNLLSNALKFTHSNGEVRLMLKRDKDHAVISVRDNGIGISPEILPNLFAPFTQADGTIDRNSGGLGLGLSIVKGIVDLHEGNVDAYSDGLGKGSEFTIRLPITAGDMPVKEETVPGKAGKKRLNILIIEDNRDFAELLCTMLCSKGYNVNIAYDGTGGLKLAKQIKPDVVFCDIGLPGMNGYDVAENIRSDDELKGIKLIALTGYAVEGDVERALKAGFDKHLAKPVSLADLQNVL